MTDKDPIPKQVEEALAKLRAGLKQSAVKAKADAAKAKDLLAQAKKQVKS
jgi:hypothetical protein